MLCSPAGDAAYRFATVFGKTTVTRWRPGPTHRAGCDASLAFDGPLFFRGTTPLDTSNQFLEKTTSISSSTTRSKTSTGSTRNSSSRSKKPLKYRVSLDFPMQVKTILEDIRAQTGASSVTEVIKRALAVYKAIVEIQAAGETIRVRDADGEERQLVIV